MGIALACVASCFVLIYGLKVPVAWAMHRAGGYDNHNPRAQQAKLEGWGRRAHAAHMNAFEAFAPFAAAVIVAHLRGADPSVINALAVVHLIARLVYPALYIADQATLRSIVWGVGFVATLSIFVVALVS